jgi:methyl-accepting chemotaxis protein
VTQQNAASSEEMATSSEELAGQAQQLLEMISFFKIDNDESVKKSYSANDKSQPSQTVKTYIDKNVQKPYNEIKKAHKGLNINMKKDIMDSDYERF